MPLVALPICMVMSCNEYASYVTGIILHYVMMRIYVRLSDHMCTLILTCLWGEAEMYMEEKLT